MSVVLLDTDHIAALPDQSARYHGQCAQLLATLDAPLATCEAVVADSSYLLRRLKRAAHAVLENVERGVFLVPYRAAERAAALRVSIDKYANVPMEFADPCLVDMAAELRMPRVLTLHSDFRVYRWGRNWHLEFLLDL